VTGLQRRKQRLIWEALGSRDPTPPEPEKMLRTMAIVGMVLFVFLFAASYPA
jgi:hypothetical protein